MGVKQAVSRWKDEYVRRQAENAVLPAFSEEPQERRYLRFFGRVQKVGFRLEVSILAERLGLTGWARNCADGSVEMELQGAREKIDFLQLFMCSLVRVKVKRLSCKALPLVEGEEGFLSDKEM